jgi:phenylacetate-CoA ligase
MSEFYTKLVANVIFPLQERLKHHDTVAIRRQMEETQWWPRERIEALQLQRLRRLISHAEQFVPYYRTLFKKIGVTVANLQSLTDLQQIPFLTKPIIRSNLEGFKSEKARYLARFNTGGSTGEPLIFFIGNERVSHDVAAKWRATRWWDVDIGDREIVVWGSPIELNAQDRVRQIRDRVMRTHLIPAFEMSEAKLDEFVATIRNFRPNMLFGYPSSLSLIARHAEKRGLIMSDLGIKVAFVTSERLYDDQRNDISRVFGCPVANGYGGRDAGFIAHQCPQGGMHITAEDIIVEIVDQQGNPVPHGTPGEIVVTHTATPDFPFVRYRTGDIAALSADACRCGRGLPLIKEIQGRSTDFVIAADGTIMHGLALIYTVRDLPGVQQFKIVQHSLDHTEVLLVTKPPFGPDAESRLVHDYKMRLGDSVKITVTHVAELPREKSGKYRYVVSNLPALATTANNDRSCAT